MKLLLLKDRYGRPSLTGGSIISEKFSQTELAEMIGSTRQTVSELMGGFSDRGIVAIRRRRIVIRDVSEHGGARSAAGRRGRAAV